MVRSLSCPLVCVLLTQAGIAQPSNQADLERVGKAFQNGKALEEQGKLKEALAAYDEALRIAIRMPGADHPFVTGLENTVGYLAMLTKDYAKAEFAARRKLDAAQRKHGPSHPEVSRCLVALGYLLSLQGKSDDAESLLLRALKIQEEKLDKDHSELARTLFYLATIYYAQEQYPKAEALYQRSLDIHEKRNKNSLESAECLEKLAWTWKDMGDDGKAETLIRRAIQIHETRQAKDDLGLAATLGFLGQLVGHDFQRKHEAEQLLQRSLDLRESKLGKNDPEVAASLRLLGDFYRGLGQQDRAEPLLRRSLDICEAKLPKDDPDLIRSLLSLASLYHDRFDYAKEEPLLLRCLELKEARDGKDHPSLVVVLVRLANIYMVSDPGKARASLERSLKILDDKLSDGDRARFAMDRSAILQFLAIHHLGQGDPVKAEELLRRSLRIKEGNLAPDRPEIQNRLLLFASLRLSQGQWQEAAQFLDREFRRQRRFAAHVLPAMSEKEQFLFLYTRHKSFFDEGLSLGRANPDDDKLLALFAEWLLNGKAIAIQAASDRALLERAATDSDQRPLVEELRALREQSARLAYTVPRAGQETQHQAQSAKFDARIQELQRRLAREGSWNGTNDGWIELPSVQQKLDARSVLIEIVQQNVIDFRTIQEGKRPPGPADGQPWLPDRYSAWIIPAAGQGKIRIIDLGHAEEIESALRKVRQEIAQTKSGRISQIGEPEAEKELHRNLESLSRLILHPLLPAIQDKERWILSPDASLWLVPWAALPLPGGQYALEKFTISYVISGRDLVTRPSLVKPGQSYILADPDFDLSADAAHTETRKQVPDRKPPDGLRGVMTSAKLPAVPRLKYSAAEAVLIKPKLEQFTASEVRSYTGTSALEGVFKQLKSPRVLVFSTHGFFLEDQKAILRRQPIELAELAPYLASESNRFENPLIRTGLLLAGCNNRDQVKPGDEDGVLTGLEIVGTDLRGTEMVVLSACETGLGQVRNGEGVAGLRQAFQLAGAQSVVATLWEISDRESARLMSDFFANLAEGKSKAEALRQAQLKMIQERRKRNGAAHPFFWAAFTLTGT